MSRALQAAEWVRACAALTADDAVLDADHLAAGRTAVARAARLSAAWVADHGCSSDCDDLCDLARELALLASQPVAPGARVTRARLARAVKAAAEAVYACRRVEHPSGRCLFSVDGPQAQVCARVLTTAHRLAAPQG